MAQDSLDLDHSLNIHRTAVYDPLTSAQAEAPSEILLKFLQMKGYSTQLYLPAIQIQNKDLDPFSLIL